MTLSLDPTQLYEDPDRSDNTYTFSFTVDERPVEPMLRFLQVPLAPRRMFRFLMHPTASKYVRQPRSNGCEQPQPRSGTADRRHWVAASQGPIAQPRAGLKHHVGYAYAQFEDVHDEVGSVSYRAVLSGSGVELEHNELLFNVPLQIFEKVLVSALIWQPAKYRSNSLASTTVDSSLPPLMENFTHAPSPPDW